jgi:hypothetical protein
MELRSAPAPRTASTSLCRNRRRGGAGCGAGEEGICRRLVPTTIMIAERIAKVVYVRRFRHVR